MAPQVLPLLLAINLPPQSRALPKFGGVGDWGTSLGCEMQRQTAIKTLKSPFSSCLRTGHAFLVATVINFSSLLGFSSLKSCGWLKVQGAAGCRTCSSLGPPYTCILLLIHTIRCNAGRRQAPPCKFKLHPLPLNIFPKRSPVLQPGKHQLCNKSWRRSPTGNASGS